MISQSICKLIKVFVLEHISDYEINCNEQDSGYFDGQICAIQYIKRHNKDKNCFFILRNYVFNPTHIGQTTDYINESTYDSDGELLCNCPTFHFVVNYKELRASEQTYFKGRNNPILMRNDIGWFYDTYQEKLCKCIVDIPPINIKDAKKYKSLDYFDDSYLVYPLPKTDNDNHQHIISCYMFTDEYVQNIMK